MHLLIEELRESSDQATRFEVLAKNGERFRTLTLGRLRIQDSLDHMPASLDALVRDLSKLENFTYPIVWQMDRFRRLKPRQWKKGLRMLTRKGIFCYEHYQSLRELKAATSLPPREAFYSTLNEEAVTEQDYQFAQDMFAFFRCPHVLDYMMLYCSLDVILLCETFLQYRKMVRLHFQLDPAHYLGKNLIMVDKRRTAAASPRRRVFYLFSPSSFLDRNTGAKF